MAVKDRRSPFNMNIELKNELLSKGHSFSFFQVMRLLNLLCEKNKADKADKPDQDRPESIRIKPNLSLAFPPADVKQVEQLKEDDYERYLVTVNMLGLYGTSSPLPVFYTEDLMDEKNDGGSVAKDFIDLINERIFRLLFDCQMKYRQFYQVAEVRNPSYLERLFCLLGLGEAEIREHIPDPDRLIRHIGLFMQFPKSALGLKILLRDSFDGVNVEVIPCVERKAKIPEEQQFRFGASIGTLGTDTFVGEEIADRMGKFRIRVGPLDKKRFRKFLPGADYYGRLAFLIKLYILEPLEYDLEIILAEGEAEKPCLGQGAWSCLGVDTWSFSDDSIGEVTTRFFPQLDTGEK